MLSSTQNTVNLHNRKIICFSKNQEIHDNLQEFFKEKTVLIIAHRLSIVKNADQIIVLKKGKIVKRGSHQELVGNKAEYYNLVKNQLELGA